MRFSEETVLFAVIGTVFVILGILVVLYNMKRTKEIERRLAEEEEEE